MGTKKLLGLPSPRMQKVWHQKDFRLEHGGKFWMIDVADWRENASSRGELRVYQVHGHRVPCPAHRDLGPMPTCKACREQAQPDMSADVTDPDLQVALQALADGRAIALRNLS